MTGDRAREVFPAAALLAVAHGSRDRRASATVEALLQRVRARRPGQRVETAYLDHCAPSVAAALSTLADDGRGRGGVVVLPLLLTAAYHSKTDIPGALAEAASRHPGMRVGYGHTLGPHPLLIAALERRLAEAGVPAGDPRTAVVLVAAGASDPGANATVAGIARQWRARGWWAVQPAYASAVSPTPAEAVAGLRTAGAPRVAVAPYLLAPGLFAATVREAALAAGAHAVAPVLGAAPELTRLVQDRYEQAVRACPARCSPCSPNHTYPHEGNPDVTEPPPDPPERDLDEPGGDADERGGLDDDDYAWDV